MKDFQEKVGFFENMANPVNQYVAQFRSLSPRSRLRFIDEVIEACEAHELSYLQEQLPILLYRDFIKLLPPELGLKILRYLSIDSLLRACHVSKCWNETINGHPSLWKAKVLAAGVSLPKNSPTLIHVWKEAAIFYSKFRSLVSKGQAFCEENRTVGRGTQHGPVAYDEGVIAYTVYSGETFISTLKLTTISGEIIATYDNRFKSSCIKVSNLGIACCGHFSGYVTVFSFRSRPRTKREFRLHTSCVMAIDINTKLGVMATSSMESDLKISKLSCNQVLKTVHSFSHWVISITIKDSSEHGIRRFEGKNVLMAMTKNDISVFSWNYDQETVTNFEGPCYVIPLICQDGWTLMDISSTPGMILKNQQIVFVKQFPMFDTKTTGNAEIQIADANTGQIVRTIPVSLNIQKLLAFGSRFALILLPYVDQTVPNVAIFDIRNRENIGGFTLPRSRTILPDHTELAVCETGWLDGISPQACAVEPVIAFGSNTGYHVFKFNTSLVNPATANNWK